MLERTKQSDAGTENDENTKDGSQQIVDFALQGENQLNRVAVVMDVRGVRSIEKLQEALAERLERRGMAPQQAAAEAGKLAYILWSAVTAPKGVQSDIVRQMTADSLDELFPPQ